MRFFIPIALIAGAFPAAAAMFDHGAITAMLPDPATAALLFGGLGLVASARRMRSNASAE